MESQKKQNGASAFRLAPCSKGKALVGVVVAAAVAGFTFLVFGPLADQRAMELAGQSAPGAVAAVIDERTAVARLAMPLLLGHPH
jgi:hypothetical protein